VRTALTSFLLVSFLAACGSSGDGAAKTTTATRVTASARVGLHTVAGAEPPRLQVTHRAQDVAPGFLFLAQKGGKAGSKGGLVIADDRGRIRWFKQLVNPEEATDFRAQTYRGKPVLTWWQGSISKAGVGVGTYYVYDDHYRQVAHVRAGNGLDGDLHEFQLTPRGTAFMTIYDEVPADLTSVGGPKDGWVYDSVVQEVDIATGKVVFQWRSLDHVPLTESMQANREPAKNATNKRPLDYFHVNSIADAPGGNILISGRNTSAVYLLARDGRVVWRLGGKKSDFGPAKTVRFAFQHNAILHDDHTLSLFDNGAIPKVEPFTRPLVFRLDQARKRATIVKTFVHPTKISSPFEGNLQLLPDGGALVGWGGVRKVTEFTPGGKVRFELKLPYGDTYRGFRGVWRGRTDTKPRVAVVGDRVYASWNGSTAVAHWDVLAGPDASHLSRIAGHDWSGLETMIQLETPPAAVAVRALDAAGKTLATSATVEP
jgi:Arylsulfotransferase (ASST)